MEKRERESDGWQNMGVYTHTIRTYIYIYIYIIHINIIRRIIAQIYNILQYK